MRGLFQAMVVGTLVLALGSDAWAGKDKDKKKDKKQQGIELTGIQSFDRVFSRVGEIDSLLTDAESQLRSGKRNLNTALDLKKGTPIADGLASLHRRAEGKLGIAMDGAVPKLAATDAVPANVQNAVDAVNGLTLNLTTSLADLRSVAPEIDRLIKDAQKLPTRLRDEFTNTNGAGLTDMLFKLPKTTKALTHDIKVTTGLAGRTTALTGRMTDILGVLHKQFPVADDDRGARRPAAQPQPGNRKGGGEESYAPGDGGGGKKKKGYGDKR